MKPILSLIVCIVSVLFAKPHLSAIEVSGLYNSYVHWDDTSEPYVISSAIQIESGITLVIHPGVEVQSGEIINGGSLIIQGTREAPVVLDGVTISYEGNDHNPPNLSISYARMFGGSLYGDYQGSMGGFVLQNSFLENLSRSIYLINDDPDNEFLIKENVFSKSGGLYINGYLDPVGSE